MSKRMIAILCIVALMATSLTACSLFGGGKKSTINGVEIEEQQYSSESGSKEGVFLIMTNKTGNDCDLEISVNFLDNNGNTIDKVENFAIRAFGKDTTIAQLFYCKTAYTSVNYNVVTKPLDYDQPVDANLKADVAAKGEDVTVTVTNTGNVTAEFVEYYVIYYKGGKVVGYNMGYCDDDNDEIKPGATVTKDEHSYSEYSNAKVYVHGTAKN